MLALRRPSRCLNSLAHTRTLRSTPQTHPNLSHINGARVKQQPTTHSPLNRALPSDAELAWSAGPGGVSPPPAAHYTDSEADIRADKGPDPPDGKSRVRLRLRRVEFEASGSARSPAQEKMRKELMADLGMND